MIAVVNHIKPKDSENYEKILEMFKNRRRMVDKFRGFRGFKLLASKDDLEIMVMTLWDNEEAFRKWVDSPQFKQGHERTGGANIEANSRGVIYEIVIDE